MEFTSNVPLRLDFIAQANMRKHELSSKVVFFFHLTPMLLILSF